MSILVTGGAGYIGAHVVDSLVTAGQGVVIVDDLVTGFADRNPGIPVVELDLADSSAPEALTSAMAEHGVTAVMHFAARKQVGESVARPAWYYQQNLGGIANLLLAMEAGGVDTFVHSSSAAVYGATTSPQVSETEPTVPINAYGDTKLMGEQLIDRVAANGALRAASLRYFNVAGSRSPELGDRAVLNLIPMVLERIGRDLPPVIFGDDYETPDGTCVRDYIHVDDLAVAHLDVLDWLAGQPAGLHERFNVGTGNGTSVREIIDLVTEVSGQRHAPVVESRRPGDPPRVVASADKITELVGWRAKHGARDMVESAWASFQHFRR